MALLQEQRYRLHFLATDAKQNIATMAVSGLGFLSAGTFNDIQLIRTGWLLNIAILIRVVSFLVTLALCILLHRAKWPRQQDCAYRVWFYMLCAVQFPLYLTRFAPREFAGPFVSTAAYLVVSYLAMRGPLWPRILAAFEASLLTIVLLWNPHAALSLIARVTSTTALIALNLIGILSVRVFEEQRHELYKSGRREKQIRQELALKVRELAAEKEYAEAMSRVRTAFLAAMSHEFRTPMNAVIGLSDLVLSAPPGAPLDGEHRENVRIINDSARALLGLLNEILDFAKIDAQKMTLAQAPFDLHQLADSVTDMFRSLAQERSLDLTVNVSPDVPKIVLGDGPRLRQVLVNLLSNALKFTNRGTVKLRVTAAETGEQTPPVPSAQDITFSVEDTGVGMSPDGIARLFRPFEQVDSGIARRLGGTGLGLTITQRIVQAMGGEIRVMSLLGRGSTFAFTIRLHATRSPLGTNRNPTATSQVTEAPLTILVVDDNPFNRHLASGWLRQQGHRVELAIDGPGAITAVLGKSYDAVFMDLQMPEMSGIEATTEIATRLGNDRMPFVIAMTASVLDEDRESCRKVGMRGFVSKPIDFAQVEALLERVRAEKITAR
jgi:signal transduction histidine kinase/CheY-like chemotaxis protein